MTRAQALHAKALAADLAGLKRAGAVFTLGTVTKAKSGSKTMKIKPPKGWDLNDPAGCWTHDFASQSKAIDYCEGFKMFASAREAEDYANTLKYSLMRLDSEVDLWTITPLNAFYG